MSNESNGSRRSPNTPAVRSSSRTSSNPSLTLYLDPYLLALQELEEARTKAQYRLEDVEEDLEEAFGKASATIGKFLHLAPNSLTNRSAEGLAKTFSPPGSPTKAQHAREEPPQTIPVVSGGRVNLSTVLPTPSPTKSIRSPARPSYKSYYIVYHGRGGMQGLFDSWKGPKDDYGPEFLCDRYEHCLSRKFSDAGMARMYYEECLDSGILDVLQDAPTQDKILFVIKGAQPGVYTKR